MAPFSASMAMSSASSLGGSFSQRKYGAASWQAVVDATSRGALLDVAEYLETQSVAKWQAVNVETKVAFDTCYATGTVWEGCAQAQFPELLAYQELYEGEHRPGLLRCHATLLRANYAPGCMLIINTSEEASCIESKLRKASDFCKAHRLASGRDAHVLLGNFQLLTSATGTRFEFGMDGTPFIAGLPAGVLKMTLSLSGNRLLTHAEYAEAKRVELTANIWSCDPGFEFCCERAPVVLDGVTRSCSAGHWKNNSIPLDSNRCSTQPVLCALALVEGE
eukprot:TRINITY_DN2200_c0_g2_i3.p1 TRINITY_DN2200_c0_g2~~TRINITY_DN2200_c0_g2_i3.p1  ORF type:complete len:278 (-),score=38.80 TRINITY_DN2200_c0_g2_i3:248-1081(-)